MTTKIFACILAIGLLLAPPRELLAQDAIGQSDWTAVKAIAVGDKLAIEMKNGERRKGTLINTSDAELTMSSKNRAASINRADIRRVYRLSGGSRMKAAVIGAGVGAGVGAGTGAVLLGASGGSDIAANVMIGATVYGAGIGAAVGALVGKGTKRTPIYESK